MRAILLGFAASAALFTPLGLAMSSPVQVPRTPAKPVAMAVLLPAGSVRTAEAAFPNCPAPAVNGMNVRVVKSAAGSAVTIFVVVQNVGNRAFFSRGDGAKLDVSMGGKSLGTFAIEKLGASEVKFFSVATSMAAGSSPADISAKLVFAAQAPIGPVANTLDCQTSDNSVVRKSQSIQVLLTQG